MIIAVNNRFISSNQFDYGQPLETTLVTLAHKFPQHRFLFIYDRPYLPEHTLPGNVKVIVAGPETSNKLRLQYWLNYKLPRLIKKHNADLLINTDGCCSLRVKRPQILIINDLEFLENPAGIKRSISRFYKKNMEAFLSKASVIITGSDHIQQVIKEKYELNAKEMELIRPGIDPAFKPMNWEQQELTREKYSNGRSYFLCSGSVGTKNLLNLLKAFTLFKKRQKSSMLLLITGEVEDDFKKEFRSYRLREEVKILEDLGTNELAELTAAAYAAVHPVDYDNIAIPVLQSFRCEVPVITSKISSLMNDFDGAALFAGHDDPKDMAEHLMLVYKDEDLAKQLVAAGSMFVKEFDTDAAAEKLMACINRAINA